MTLYKYKDFKEKKIILPKIKDRGFFSEFGYKLSDNIRERHKKINIIILKEGILSALKHLNLIRTLHKNTKYFDKLDDDVKYLQRLYDDFKNKKIKK